MRGVRISSERASQEEQNGDVNNNLCVCVCVCVRVCV